MSELAIRSKGHWGYSEEFLEACREELTYSPEQFTDPRFAFLVAEEGDAILGFCALERVSPASMEINALFVEPSHMRRGVGRLLLQRAKGFARSKGIDALLTQSDPGAKEFYIREGGVVVGEKESGSIPGRMLPLLSIPTDSSGSDEFAPVEAPLFAVGLPKLLVLSLCSLGLYELYWFYQNWCRIQKSERHVTPFWRAFFSGIWCIPLTLRIEERARRVRVTGLPLWPLGLVWVAMNVLWRLPGAYGLLSLFTVVPLLVLQAVVDRVNAVDAPYADPNTGLSRWNIVTIIVGGIMFSFALLGAFLPED